MKGIEGLERKVNSNKNRNTRFVKVNECSRCSRCGGVIFTGTKCLTTNRRGVGRRWVCMKCFEGLIKPETRISGVGKECSIYRRILHTKAKLSSVAFDDDGAYIALEELLSEDIGKCMECNSCRFCVGFEGLGN